MAARSRQAAPRLRGEAIQFRLIYAAGFSVFLAAAVARRLLLRPAHGGVHRTIFGEAKADANTYIPFAFMG